LDALAATVFDVETGHAPSLQDVQCFGYGTQKIYFDLGDYVQQSAPERYAEYPEANEAYKKGYQK
jgi:hypothetical protein